MSKRGPEEPESFGGLGLGLPGARRLMDEFEIANSPGNGATVCMIKWRR